MKYLRKYTLSRPINLNLTLYPSFNLVLLDRIDENKYLKVIGKDSGKLLTVISPTEIISDISEELMHYLTGEWFYPEKYIAYLKGRLLKIVKAIISRYSEVSLSVNPFDRVYMFISIFLSKTTNFHVNVIKWCKRIWKISEGDISRILKIDMKVVGNSFQLKQLPRALSDYLKYVKPYEEDLTRDSWGIRKQLLKCWGCGPKIADAYLLFVAVDEMSVPCDKHLVTMVNRLDLVSYSKLPQKNYCLKNTCVECPLAEECLRSVFAKTFGRLSGWLQTIFYIHDKLYCRKGLCKECFLAEYCKKTETR